LPPVVRAEEESIFNTVYATPYFLSAHCLSECVLHTIELKKIYRQTDKNFISILNSIRTGKVEGKELDELNKKVSKDIFPKDLRVYLTTTNKKASFINNKYLSQISDKEETFYAETENIDENSKQMPAEYELVVKKNAQVMMLNNDSKGRWVNGSIGKICEIKKANNSDKSLIMVEFLNGRIEAAEPYKWELFRYKWNEKLERIETENVGFFKQYPLKLSWAVTIHKSQGKSFDKIIVDMEYGAFAPGQLYVALSRCTTLDGITLTRPLTRRDILPPKIEYFNRNQRLF
jgi:hypothetical protein